jgi:hypothetical protein
MVVGSRETQLSAGTADAWRIARGEAELPDDAPVLRIWGGKNSYNARGRGSTSARRAYDGRTWRWVAPPTSRGRSYAADRHDTTYGDVYPGEIIAEFTLGERGTPTPHGWYLVRVHPEKPLVLLHAIRRTKQGYVLAINKQGMTPEESAQAYGTIVVPDPAWR